MVSSCSTYLPNAHTEENSEKLRGWEEKGIAGHFLQWEISLNLPSWKIRRFISSQFYQSESSYEES